MSRPSVIQTPVGLSQSGRLLFLLKDSALYGGAAALSKAFALITFPLLARHFTVAEYGVFDYLGVLAALGTTFFVFGQDSAIARYFYEDESIEERRQLISQSLAFQLVGLAIFVPILWFSAEWLTSLLIAVPDRVLLFKIVCLQLPFLLVINFSQNLLKWTFARLRFLTMSLGFTVMNATLLVIAVLLFDADISDLLQLGLVTSSVFASLGIFFVRGWLTLPKNFRHLRKMLPFALPYGVICAAGAFSPTLERTLATSLLGSEALGLYAAATKIAMLVALLVGTFQVSWGPFSLALYKQADAGQTYNWVLKLFVVGICLAVLATTLLAQPLIHFFATDRYAGAAIVVFPLVMGLAIQATSWITEIGIGLSKRSYLNLYAYTAAILVTLSGIWLLVPRYGLLGIGLGVMFGHVARAMMASWLAQRAYPLPWHYVPVFVVLVVTMVAGFFATWMQTEYSLLGLGVAIFISMSLVLLVGWLVVLNQVERKRVLALFTMHSNSK